MPATVEQLVARGVVDRVTVVTRSQGVLYERAVTPDVAGAVSVEVRQAIEAGRKPAAMTSREGQQWVREFVASSARITRLPDVAEDLQTTMQRVAVSAPEIIRHTHGPATRAAARDAVKASAVPQVSRGHRIDHDQARWWVVGVTHATTRGASETSTRADRDSAATRIARDIDKSEATGLGR